MTAPVLSLPINLNSFYSPHITLSLTFLSRLRSSSENSFIPPSLVTCQKSTPAGPNLFWTLWFSFFLPVLDKKESSSFTALTSFLYFWPYKTLQLCLSGFSVVFSYYLFLALSTRIEVQMIDTASKRPFQCLSLILSLKSTSLLSSPDGHKWNVSCLLSKIL